MYDAAHIVAVLVQRGNRGRGSHIDYDNRQRVVRLRGDRVDNQIGADVLRVVHADIHTRLHAGAHEFAGEAGDLANRLGNHGVQRGNHARQNGALELLGRDVMEVQDAL